MDLAKAYQLVGKLTHCYETAIGLFGSPQSFREKTAIYRHAIAAVMKRQNCDELKAGLELMGRLRREGHLTGMRIMLITATVYDMVEIGELEISNSKSDMSLKGGGADGLAAVKKNQNGPMRTSAGRIVNGMKNTTLRWEQTGRKPGPARQ